jgi:hypothetical protein
MLACDTMQLQLDRLESALAEEVTGRERPWSEQLGDRVNAVAQALRQHKDSTEAPGGLLAGSDLTRLSRRVGELCQEHREFLQDLVVLREGLLQAAQAFQQDPRSPATVVPIPGKVGAVPDFGALRREAQDLLAALRKHTHEETDLVLEGVTTDIGAGD